VNATPQDAEILLDGASRGTGTVTSSYPAGTRVALKVHRRGYTDYEESIQLVGESGIVKAAVLRPSELYGTTKVSNSGLISGLVAADQRLFAADSKGAVFAFNADGAVLWSAKTGNSDNENSRPVLGAGLLAFAGDKALCVLDASSGKPKYSVPLDATDTGLFGRRPAIAGGKLYLATSTGIKIFAVDSGASLGTIALPDDVEMTPAVVGTTIYAASVGGVFYIMDGERQSLTGQIKTPAAQPYAAAPLISGGSAYFVDRKGLAVCIDLGSQTLVWSKRVDAGKNLNVLQDVVLGDAGLYVFAKATIYGLSLKSGERLFDPIGGVSSAPAIEAGSLWFGTQDGAIVAVDPVSGKKRATLAAPARVVGAPIASGDLLAFPTGSGEAIFVNPAVVLH
jgi:outer membrane protein assembly factor BamB